MDIGGLCGIHQFTELGRMSMIGAHSMITKDVPPMSSSEETRPSSTASISSGMRPNGLSPETRMEIQRAYKILYRSGLNVSQAIEEMERELPGNRRDRSFLQVFAEARSGASAGKRKKALLHWKRRCRQAAGVSFCLLLEARKESARSERKRDRWRRPSE